MVDAISGLISPSMSRRWSQILTFSFGTIAVSIVLYTRWRHHSELKKRRRKKKQGSVNVGAIFGMDVGGTLTKLVYFEANMDKNAQSSPETGISPPVSSDTRPSSSSTASSLDNDVDDTPPPQLRRNQSFPTLETADHKAALKQLYNFMDRGQGQSNETVSRDENLSFYSTLLDGKMHFLHLETRNLVSSINYLSSTAITDNIRTIGCTGGGAHKYAKQFEEQLDIKFQQMDELGSLLKGMDFALTNVAEECYTYRYDEASEENSQKSGQSSISSPSGKLPHDQHNVQSKWSKDVKEYTRKVTLPKEIFVSKGIFPYLVVNIGSGVSIIKVDAPGKFNRVSGSSLGGGTYWGLCRLLTHCATYEEVLDLAESGDASEIDMLVRDIYGGGYDAMNLSGSMVASSFGKLVMKENPRDGVKEEDLAIALLMMITNNIGQVSYLNAQLHGCSKIFFVGSFLRHNPISCRRLSFSIDFWSKGKMEALFLKHEGYFGALGTFLDSAFGSEVGRILTLGHGGDAENCLLSEGAALSFAAGTSGNGSASSGVRTASTSGSAIGKSADGNGKTGCERWLKLRQKPRGSSGNLRRWNSLRFSRSRDSSNNMSSSNIDAVDGNSSEAGLVPGLEGNPEFSEHSPDESIEIEGGSEDEYSPNSLGFGRRMAAMGIGEEVTTRSGRRAYSQEDIVVPPLQR